MSIRIALMFSGQGAQHPGMGKDFFEQYAGARDLFREADLALGRPLSDLCFHGSQAELTASANCQPGIFSVSLAAYQALQAEYPFKAQACAGLSLGEYAALHCAGALGFAQTLKLVARRGELMDQACRQQNGGMAALLGLEPELIEQLCAKHQLEVANYNSPDQTIVSGPDQAIDAALENLRALRQKAVRLQVAGAFHSSLMLEAQRLFAPELDKVQLSPPRCRLAQNYSGGFASDPAEISANLLRQVSGSVRWEACFRLLMSHSDVCLELGPGNVLSSLAKRINRNFPVFSINSVDSLHKTLSALRELQ
ncbi:MAG: ACP S-malonyltransferase [Lentisphaeria bacterium]